MAVCFRAEEDDWYVFLLSMILVAVAGLVGLEVVVIRMAYEAYDALVMLAMLVEHVVLVILVILVMEWVVESRWVKFLSVLDRLRAWNCFVLECQTWM